VFRTIAGIQVFDDIGDLLRHGSREVWSAVVETFSEVGPQCLPKLIGLIRDKEDLVAYGAVEALAQSRTSIDDLIVNMMRDPTLRCRALDLIGLRATISDDVEAAVLELLTTPLQEMRVFGIEALRHIHTKPSKKVPALLNLLGDLSATVRSRVVSALSELDFRAVRDPVELLRSTNPLVRRSMAELLGRIKPPQHELEVLKQMEMHDPDRMVRAAAHNAVLSATGGEGDGGPDRGSKDSDSPTPDSPVPTSGT
jgi:HEAT repeat protein